MSPFFYFDAIYYLDHVDAEDLSHGVTSKLQDLGILKRTIFMHIGEVVDSSFHEKEHIYREIVSKAKKYDYKTILIFDSTAAKWCLERSLNNSLGDALATIISCKWKMCLLAELEALFDQPDDNATIRGDEIDLARVVAVTIDVGACKSVTDFTLTNVMIFNKVPKHEVLRKDSVMNPERCFLVELMRSENNAENVWNKALIRCNDFRLEEIDGELMLYHPIKTEAVYLNATSSVLWGLCDGQHNCQEIAGLLTDVYPKQQATVIKDLRETLVEFLRLGIVEVKR